ncbi:MAG TPA: cytochrome c oxidase assembly protein [Alphaproteobacteria bacterium]|nr:cytochrome c oxidase assembly protein [Alphaproteobacteria bacterium]|tara:strand:- start:506 stop:1081 length:576 start_codon:yes stop_codon:yes gene_type:complete
MSVPATQHIPEQGAGNRRILVILAVVVAAMVGLAYASVPLYQLFCQVTGYGGTTQISGDAAVEILPDHPVRVRFDANTNPALNWRFEAVDAPVTLNPGEEVVINYRATNLGDTASAGTSTYNVTPVKAGPHFMKIDCFCFIEQTLQPGESVLMPVRFYIDPDIASEPGTADIDEIILSYTFFPVLGGSEDT